MAIPQRYQPPDTQGIHKMNFCGSANIQPVSLSKEVVQYRGLMVRAGFAKSAVVESALDIFQGVAPEGNLPCDHDILMPASAGHSRFIFSDAR